MAFLPPSELTLSGGCMCAAIRYTIRIPALEERPLYPLALPTPITAAGDSVATRFPLIAYDHYSDCRRSCGVILQCWFICQQDWVEFALLARVSDGETTTSHPCSDVADPKAEIIEKTYLGVYQSSPKVHRCFCTRCGTSLTFATSQDKGPDWTLGPLVDVATGTLDEGDIDRAQPERHGWWEDGTSWLKEMVEGGGTHWLIRHPAGQASQQVDGNRGSGARGVDHVIVESADMACK
jgi:hypothetical protein